MKDISFSLLELNTEIISIIEQIRFNAYDIDSTDFSGSFYARNLDAGKYVVFGVFYNDKLVGACYVSKSYNSLYVEQLFILKKLQRSGLHLGSGLLKYVLSQKEYIENYFTCSFECSYLDSVNNTAVLYEAMGYKPSKNLLMRKRLN